MPNLSHDDLKRWKDRVNSVVKYAQADGRKESYQEFLDMYNNRFNVSVRGALDQVNVNHVFPNVRIKSSYLAQKKPKFFVSPRKPKWNDAAQLIEAALLSVWGIGDVAWTMRMVLLDASIFPHGAIRVGYQFDEDRFSDNVKDFPYVKRVSPRDIFWDLNITDSNPRTGRFMFERFYTIKDQLREQGFKYVDDIDPIGFESDYFRRKEQGGRVRSVVRSGVDQEGEIVEIFRIQDKIERLNIWISMNGDAPHFVEDWKLPLKSFDYHILQFNPVPDQIFAMSDVEVYRNQQIELNKIRTYMINHINRASRRWVTQKGTMTPDEKNALLESGDQMITEITGDPSRIIPLSDAPMPADFFRVQELIQQDIRQLSGVSEFELSASIPSGDTTATAAALVQSATRRRTDDANAVYEKFLTDTAKDIILILQEHVPLDFWINVTDREQVAKIQGLTEFDGNFFRVKKNQIQGDMIVTIDPGSMKEQSDPLRVQQFNQALSLLITQPAILQRLDVDKLLLNIAELYEFPQDIVKSQEQFAAEQQEQLMMQMAAGGQGMPAGETPEIQNLGTPPAQSAPDLGQLLAQAMNLGGVGGAVEKF